MASSGKETGRPAAAGPSVLLVCLGNICRSPMAEGALRAEARRLGLSIEVDSAGIGDWHAGGPPDPRAIATAAKYGIDIGDQRARQIRREDFARYDHVIALDASVMTALARLRPAGSRAGLSLFMDHVADRAGQCVADPYHGDDAAFETSWSDVLAGARALAGRLASE